MNITLIKRTGQASPLTASQYDANLDAIEAAFATITNVGGGSVTSVGLAMPSIFTVTNSPVTSSGALTATLNTQTANTIFAGPTTGSAAAPTFRAIVAGDLPAVPVSKGGTGNTSFTASRVVVTDGSGNQTSSSVTSTEVAFLSGVTSAIQTQLNGKQNTITTLPIANGGTNASTAQTARLNLLPAIAGNALKVLRVNAGATDMEWSTPSAAVASVNSLTGALTLTTGTSGTDVNVGSAGTTLTINVPSASGTNRGVITTGAQTIAGVKTFTSTPIVDTLTDTFIVYSNGSKQLQGTPEFTYDGAVQTVPQIRQTKVQHYTSAGSTDPNDVYVMVEQSAAIALDLPEITPTIYGQRYVIADLKGQAATWNITIRPFSGDIFQNVVNGTFVMNANYQSVVVYCNEVNGDRVWIVESQYKPA